MTSPTPASAIPPETPAQPRHQHDCSHCTFLGHHGEVDLYFCGKSRGATVIGRFSSDGPDYFSGLDFSYGRIPALGEARHRAQARGLMQYDLAAALHHMPAGAAQEFKDELLRELEASSLGQALVQLATDEVAGTAAVRRYIDEQAGQFQQQFPHLELAELERWAQGHLSNAQNWLARLNLPRAATRRFAHAVYDL